MSTRPPEEQSKKGFLKAMFDALTDTAPDLSQGIPVEPTLQSEAADAIPESPESGQVEDAILPPADGSAVPQKAPVFPLYPNKQATAGQQTNSAANDNQAQASSQPKTLPSFLAQLRREEDPGNSSRVLWYTRRDDIAPAFVESPEGIHFKTSIDNQEAIRLGLALAQHRGWVPATLSGTEQFRRVAFFEACRLGLETTGYQPTELDLAALKKEGLTLPNSKPQFDPQNAIKPPSM